jgi:hypothetical protein
MRLVTQWPDEAREQALALYRTSIDWLTEALTTSNGDLPLRGVAG